MSKIEEYSQCVMRKPLNTGGYKELTGWIDSTKAEVGRVLRWERDDGTSEDGFEVISVGHDKFPAKYVELNSRNYLKQREASDI